MQPVRPKMVVERDAASSEGELPLLSRCSVLLHPFMKFQLEACVCVWSLLCSHSWSCAYALLHPDPFSVEACCQVIGGSAAVILHIMP
ncbi:uncharacterized protein LOC125540220 isoform X3 [Triticum urartu]|uniref:uncharacterized protein LOC125540220 isoform X3 n=1 Tax=Triticum urartu TaxID=4572 RepID=UPI0020432386|nr:uncharacterized protein LOC125540220 isoform X3 [Triticum urartu]